MPHLLEFDILHHYDFRVSGIEVPVGISLAGNTVDLVAKLDTGASLCIFQRQYGELLGLRIETGRSQWVSTATGRFLTYGHPVTLEVLGLSFETTAYFAADPQYLRNVLGRRGFLDLVRIALIDYDGRLYLGPHEE